MVITAFSLRPFTFSLIPLLLQTPFCYLLSQVFIIPRRCYTLEKWCGGLFIPSSFLIHIAAVSQSRPPSLSSVKEKREKSTGVRSLAGIGPDLLIQTSWVKCGSWELERGFHLGRGFTEESRPNDPYEFIVILSNNKNSWESRGLIMGSQFGVGGWQSQSVTINFMFIFYECPESRRGSDGCSGDFSVGEISTSCHNGSAVMV